MKSILLLCLLSVTSHAIETEMTAISAGVQTFSRKMDSFFSREAIEFEDTGTRLRVGYAMELIEFEEPQYDLFAKARLVLPHTQEKFQLLFESDEPNNSDLVDKDSATSASVDESVRDKKFAVGLRGFVYKSELATMALDTGIRLRSQLDPFGRFTALRDFVLAEDRAIKLGASLYHYRISGWGGTLSADYDQVVLSSWLFRFGHIAEWTKEPDPPRADGKELWQYNHSLTWFKKRSERTSVRYSAGILSDDDQTLALRSYYILLGVRREILSPWVYLDVVPKLSWPREHDWNQVASLFVKLEATF